MQFKRNEGIPVGNLTNGMRKERDNDMTQVVAFCCQSIATDFFLFFLQVVHESYHIGIHKDYFLLTTRQPDDSLSDDLCYDVSANHS